MIALEKPFSEDSRRKKIVFLHGFLGNEDEFKHVGRIFEHSHDVIYSVRPCERSEAIHVLGNREQPGLLHNVRNDERVHLIGYSMGGRIALQIACKYPELIRHLTLISASPGLRSAKERRSRLLYDRALAQDLRRVGMRQFLSFWYRQPLFKDFRAHPYFQQLLQRRLQQDPNEQADILERFSVGAQTSLWSQIPNLRMPIDLISGERDTKFCNIAHEMAALNSRIRVTVVAKVGHVVHWEAQNVVKERLWNVEYRMASCPNL